MRPRGFTLIELLIGVVIVAILMLLAVPTFNEFMANARIRNTADSLANGIRHAQVEAIKRNRPIEFIVDPAVGWRINDPDPVLGGPVQSDVFSDTNSTITVGTMPAGTARLVFSGIGQYLLAGEPGVAPLVAPDPITHIEVTSAALANTKNLRVEVDPARGVGIRVCDPDFLNPADPKTGSIACLIP
jgi:type IV fimbrial biogenesis protein FimT